jgi:hypothetical protein
MLSLSTSYEKFLQSASAQILTTHTTLSLSPDSQNVSLSMTPTASVIVIPPMNANLNFSTVSKLSIDTMKQQAAGKPVVLPTFFNWADKNSQLTPPPNQGKCGSCWAVAVASAISDNYVTRNLVPKNPQLSPTFLLSCVPDSLKCGGGNPALSLQWIAKNGLAATADVASLDYSWCSSNAVCNGSQKEANSTYDVLNQLLPGCPNDASLKFFVSSITMPQLTPDQAKDPVQLATATTSVKTFLYTKGPAVTGFSVLENFLGGNYTCGGRNPDNIYLEKVDYKQQKWVETPFKFLGGHAVVVVGWGVGKVAESLLKKDGSDQTRVDVPYWIARNSWDTKWGIGGYFRIAQYPFNIQSQFDATVFVQETVQDPSTGQTVLQNLPTGGILFFETNYFGYGEPTMMESFYPMTTTPTHSNAASETALYFIFGMLVFMMVLTVFILVLTANPPPAKKLKA